VPNTRPGGFGRHASRVRGLPEFDNELPASTLADEILTPGVGQIKALFTGAGNPVLSTPNGSKLDLALESLDFMVSLDFYINETTRHADIILPPTSPLEHDHYDLAFHINAIRNTARFNEPVFEKPLNTLHDWEIFSRLGALVARELDLEPRQNFSPSELIDASLKSGPYGRETEENLSLETLRKHPSGIDLGPLKKMLPDRLLTPNKKIVCDTNEPVEALSKLSSEFKESPESSLYLIGRRHVRSNNSWMHNFRRLVKGKNRCTLLMHPDDMQKRGLTDGNAVRVTSRVKSIDVAVETCLDIMRGTVSLPHGYGHNRKDIRLRIAETTDGASCNDITDEMYLDKLSGNAAINGVLVSVKNIEKATETEIRG
jgi:anaerobic selenocysteine-containing dehydrogenase